MTKANKVRGFTLAELLIVILIIGALVAITIPIFTSSVDEAEEAACAANRRSLKSSLSYAYIVNYSAADAEDEFQAKKDSFTCPSGGLISYTINSKTGVVTVKCSKHQASFGIYIDDIMDSMKASLPGASRIDSGAIELSGSHASAAVASLSSKGIDLEELGAKSWHYENVNGKPYLRWSTVDISAPDFDPKAPLYVIQYRADTGNYTVWKGTVGTDSLKGSSYNTLAGVSGKVLNTDQSFEGAMAKYNELTGN